MQHSYYNELDKAVSYARRATSACYYKRSWPYVNDAMSDLITTLEKSAKDDCKSHMRLAKVYEFEHWVGRDIAKAKRHRDYFGKC